MGRDGLGARYGLPLRPELPARIARLPNRMCSTMPQRPVELILARELASSLTVAVLLVDEKGDTLFFNEPAELIFGRHFDEIDALPFEERAAILAPRRENGQPMPVEDLPGMVAMRQRRPVHATFHMHGLDGVLRPLEATAIPLENAGGDLLGAFVLMWSPVDDAARHSASTAMQARI